MSSISAPRRQPDEISGLMTWTAYWLKRITMFVRESQTPSVDPETGIRDDQIY